MEFDGDFDNSVAIPTGRTSGHPIKDSSPSRNIPGAGLHVSLGAVCVCALRIIRDYQVASKNILSLSTLSNYPESYTSCDVLDALFDSPLTLTKLVGGNHYFNPANRDGTNYRYN
jgi:hypothetical protein